MIRELHARPFGAVDAPAQLFHYGLVYGGGSAEAEFEKVVQLCHAVGVDAPLETTTHVSVSGPDWYLTWERHTEFSTYTFRIEGQRSEAEARAMLPSEWIGSLTGEVISDCHIVLAVEIEDEAIELGRWFDGNLVIGGTAVGGRARVWTTFDRDDQGIVRFWVHDLAMTARQTGRLVQRLLEIHDYTLMAMLGLPAAWDIMPDISTIEASLVEIADLLTHDQTTDEEQRLLGRLSRLAAEVEALEGRVPFRFNAARAYHAIVQRRVQEIREQRIEGQQSIANFLERRLSPAMRTIEATHGRLDSLSERIGRTTQMLRARVDVQLAQQNRDLLASMDRRVQLQLRLQSTVEGVSIAAITYYATGLVSYLAQGLNATGYVHLPKEIVVAITIPIIAVILWQGMKRVRKIAGG